MGILGHVTAATLTASGALFVDAAGRVLLVEPTYKTSWEIPGGVMEGNETPREACRRELLEELGLDIEPGPLLVVDFAPTETVPRILFVFDGGTLTGEQERAIVLQAAELASYAYVAPADAPTRLVPRLARRVAAALDARGAGVTRYLEHGLPV